MGDGSDEIVDCILKYKLCDELTETFLILKHGSVANFIYGWADDSITDFTEEENKVIENILRIFSDL